MRMKNNIKIANKEVNIRLVETTDVIKPLLCSSNKRKSELKFGSNRDDDLSIISRVLETTILNREVS